MKFIKHPTAIVDSKAHIGAYTKIWHFSHISDFCQIGQKCIVGQNVYIAPRVVIGDNVKIQNNVSIYTGVVIEDNVFIGPSVVFTNVINPRAAIERKDEFKQTVVKQGASIGANATILCGITIGKYAMIGAGAVVTKDVDDFAVVVGNPAKVIGCVDEDGNKVKPNEETL